MHTRGIVKKRGFTRGVVKSVISLRSKVFLWNSYRTGAPQKIKAPENFEESGLF